MEETISTEPPVRPLFDVVEGSTILDVFITILPSFFTACLARQIEVADVGHRLFLEFVVTVVPIMLITTILAEYKMLLLLVCAIPFYLVHMKNICSVPALWDMRVQHKKEWYCISYVRSMISLMTVHCILAIDFHVFPKYMMKTERYGFSLMDTGVGLFVFANGLVSPKISKYGLLKSIEQNIKPCFVLLILGYLRYAILREINYNQNVNEYGLHWNFFVTLALTKLCGVIILHLFKEQNAIFCGAGLLIVHEFLLYYSLHDWVFGDVARSNFLDANREGISSILGFVAIFLISTHFGQVIRERYDRKTEGGVLNTLLYSVGITWTLTYIFSLFFKASRCLANMEYSLFILSIGVTVLTLFYVFELTETTAKNTEKHSKERSQFGLPVTLNAINRNGLLFFLIGNVATGLVNMLFRTVHLNTIFCLVILTLYNTFVIAIIVGWEQRKTPK